MCVHPLIKLAKSQREEREREGKRGRRKGERGRVELSLPRLANRKLYIATAAYAFDRSENNYYDARKLSKTHAVVAQRGCIAARGERR